MKPKTRIFVQTILIGLGCGLIVSCLPSILLLQAKAFEFLLASEYSPKNYEIYREYIHGIIFLGFLMGLGLAMIAVALYDALEVIQKNTMKPTRK